MSATSARMPHPGAADADDPLPVVGIPCCTRAVADHQGFWVSEKYVLAAIDASGALPLLVPGLGSRVAAEAIVTRLDGLLITGSRSNVEPHHYGGEPSLPDTPHDALRDATTLPLIRAALAADLPVLGICRGIQELNVALGGTLHQRVHELPGRLNHRAPQGTVDERYGHRAHPVALAPGGLFEHLAGTGEIMVNSLHGQGIDRLAPDLVVEAIAPDGQIEAVRVATASFVVGVQWHPEYRALENPVSRALFAAFGDACRARALRRRRAA
jgi:putative glutamine amidotransferase